MSAHPRSHIWKSIMTEATFSDIKVVVLGKTFRLHKVVLLQSPFMARLMADNQDVSNSLTLDLCGDPRITKRVRRGCFWDLYDSSEGGRTSRIHSEDLMNVLAASCFFELEDLATYCNNLIMTTMSFDNVMEFAKSMDTLRPSSSLIRLTSYGPEHQYHSLLKSHCTDLHAAILSYLCQCVNTELTRGEEGCLSKLVTAMPISWLRRIIECDVLAVTSEFERYELLKSIVLIRRRSMRNVVASMESGESTKRPSSLFGDYMELGSAVFGRLGGGAKRKVPDDVKVGSSSSQEVPRPLGTPDMAQGLKAKNQAVSGLLNLYGALGGAQTDAELMEDNVIMSLFDTGIRYTYMSFTDLEKVKGDKISFWMQAEMTNGGHGQAQTPRPIVTTASRETDFRKPFRFSARFQNDGDKTMVLLCYAEEDLAGHVEGGEKKVLKAHLQRNRLQASTTGPVSSPFVSYSIYDGKEKWRRNGHIKAFEFPPSDIDNSVEGDGTCGSSSTFTCSLE
ncbi:hypothetical protein BC829DRAFT_404978 [Chytridium lagenaria]|nr:hypothetical protein BC829DRAFT_404978 [Chytridium lagenaria]